MCWQLEAIKVSLVVFEKSHVRVSAVWDFWISIIGLNNRGESGHVKLFFDRVGQIGQKTNVKTPEYEYEMSLSRKGVQRETTWKFYSEFLEEF
jgi:hypothetical protein